MDTTFKETPDLAILHYCHIHNEGRVEQLNYLEYLFIAFLFN